MEKKFYERNAFIFSIFIVIVFVVIIYNFSLTPKGGVSVHTEDSSALPVGRELCFAKYTKPNQYGDIDEYTLRLSMHGSKATGELGMFPAEKDSKAGIFTGTVGPLEQSLGARRADLIWDVSAEGQTYKEDLKIIFGEGTASIGFGEMILGEDGVYVYKDPENISYSLDLYDVDCSTLPRFE